MHLKTITRHGGIHKRDRIQTQTRQQECNELFPYCDNPFALNQKIKLQKIAIGFPLK
jgi:hypothetical protein